MGRRSDRPGLDAARQAAERWTRQGRRVRLALPRPSPGGGYDFNDLLRQHGATAVGRALEAAELFGSGAQATAREQLVAAVKVAIQNGPSLPRQVLGDTSPFYGTETEDTLEEAQPRLQAVMRDAIRERARWGLFRDLRGHASAFAIWQVLQDRPDLAQARHGRKDDPKRKEFFARVRALRKEKLTRWHAALDAKGWHPPAQAPATLVVRAMAGLGKTHGLIAELRDFFRDVPDEVPVRVSVLVPNHGMTAQLERDATAAGIAAVVLAGRRQKDRDGEPLCPRAATAQLVAERGLSVTRDLCAGCPLREQCGYFRQGRGLPTRGILIATHDALPLGELPGGVEMPSFMVVDEGATKVAIGDPLEIPWDLLGDQSLWPPIGGQDAVKAAIHARNTCRALREVLQDIADGVCSVDAWREALESKNV
ncbi:MAG TPA: hypothetical protein VD970_15655, partial [Acetobacteraceae bacterium]|nr:hypothetical protein [Acetobacteraceae bacterium]